MADYQESAVSGTRWRRCVGVDVHNPATIDPEHPKIPSIAFREQDVMILDGQLLTLGNTNCGVIYDPAAVVQVYDPVTLEPTGATFTHQQLYGMLFSAYLDTALRRDADAAANQ